MSLISAAVHWLHSMQCWLEEVVHIQIEEEEEEIGEAGEKGEKGGSGVEQGAYPDRGGGG